MRLVKWIFVGVFCAVFSVSCNDYEIATNIPYCKVYYEIYLMTTDKDLIGAYKSIPFDKPPLAKYFLGYGGLLLVDAGVEIKAFDLSCQVEAMRDVRVKPNDNGEAVCPKCGAKYNLFSGTCFSPSGVYPLQQYAVSCNSYTGVYYVTNR